MLARLVYTFRRNTLAVTLADELEGGEEKGEETGGDAAEGEDEGQPASVGLGAVRGVAPEEKSDRGGAGGTERKDAEAGTEEGTGVGLHVWRRTFLAVGGEHGVDDDAAYGHIEPDGIGVAGESLVGGEATGERKKEGDQDHREGDDGGEDVWGEKDPEI